jgi:hypothetical protein
VTEQERVIWDKAFEVAYKACSDHVSFANKREYAYKVGQAFIRSIRSGKRKAEKELTGG